MDMDVERYLTDPRLYGEYITRHLLMAYGNLSKAAESPTASAESQRVLAAAAQAQAMMALVVAVQDLTVAVRGGDR